MKQFVGELTVSVGLIVLLLILFNPWSMAMPGYFVMCLLVGIVVLFAGFAIFLWKEKQGDERERFHLLFADRAAYLTGAAILIVGIIVDELRGAFNPWLIFALAGMILAKVASLIYGKVKL